MLKSLPISPLSNMAWNNDWYYILSKCPSIEVEQQSSWRSVCDFLNPNKVRRLRWFIRRQMKQCTVSVLLLQLSAAAELITCSLQVCWRVQSGQVRPGQRGRCSGRSWRRQTGDEALGKNNQCSFGCCFPLSWVTVFELLFDFQFMY